jgi:2-alkenal reductase
MELDSGQRGVLVINVQANSPADQAGLLGSSKTAAIDGQEVPVGGDVITTVNGEQVDTVASLRDALQQYKPGEEVTLSILRDGKSLDIPVTLGERPES